MYCRKPPYYAQICNNYSVFVKNMQGKFIRTRSQHSSILCVAISCRRGSGVTRIASLAIPRLGGGTLNRLIINTGYSSKMSNEIATSEESSVVKLDG